jgi:hypothetical protein
VDPARSAFDAAVAAHLDAAVHLHGAAADSREDNAEVRQLRELLAAQATRLGAAAGQLGVPAPRLDVDSAPATPDVAAALDRAETSMRQADARLQGALRVATLPVLLPESAPALRATLVYGTFCLVAWVVQFSVLTVTDYRLVTALASLCGLPLLAFGAGLLTLYTLGQPRSGDRIRYSTWLGVVVCFAGLPLMWLILLVAFTLFRG